MRGGQACLCALCAFVPLTNLDRLYAVLHGSHADAIQLEPFDTMLKRAAAKLLRKRPDLSRALSLFLSWIPELSLSLSA